jgi:carboxypeptidase Taq
MIAAQLWEKVAVLRPGIEDEFARGDFTWLLGWLRQNVHAVGRRHDALTLVRNITGAELSPQPLIRYLKQRYGALYLK